MGKLGALCPALYAEPVCRALYVKHRLVAFSRSVSESMQNTALCLENSPEFLAAQMKSCCRLLMVLWVQGGDIGSRGVAPASAR